MVMSEVRYDEIQSNDQHIGNRFKKYIVDGTQTVRQMALWVFKNRLVENYHIYLMKNDII